MCSDSPPGAIVRNTGSVAGTRLCVSAALTALTLDGEADEVSAVIRYPIRITAITTRMPMTHERVLAGTATLGASTDRLLPACLTILSLGFAFT